MRKQFKVWLYEEDLDAAITENVRTSDQAYAIRLRERVEADHELKETSANKLEQQGVNTITLMERLIYELKYYAETGQHLDEQNVTLCAGSRFAVGSVPDVRWYAGRLHVGWYYRGIAHSFSRARAAV